MKKLNLMARVTLFIFVLSAIPANAGGGSVSGTAREITQLWNNTELNIQTAKQIAQLVEQIKMVEDMIFNTLSLPQNLMGDLTGNIRSIMKIYDQLQGTLHSLSNLDERFFNSLMFIKGADNMKEWVDNYSEQYWEMSVELERYATRALEELGISGETIMDSARTLEKLQKNAASASGRNEYLQAQTDFLAFASGQLIELQRKADRQFEAYILELETQRTLRDTEKELIEEDIRRWVQPDYGEIRFSGWDVW